MNAWNTINALSAKPLEKAILVLETMSTDLSISILEYLKRHKNATLLDLTIALGMDSSTIESQLDLLMMTGVIRPKTDLYNTTYKLNLQRVRQVSGIAKKLCDRKPKQR